MSYKSHNEAAAYAKDGTPLYGLSAELYLKTQGKKDVNMEREVSQWISQVTGEKLEGELEDSLKDGVILCKLVNKIKPGIVSKINTNRMPFMQMENISNFLRAIDSLGLGRHDQFQTVDLYEAKNMPQVVSSLYALGGLCQSKLAKQLPSSFPTMGIKYAEKRNINFTEQQLREAANTVGGQTGAASLKIDQGRSIRNEVVKSTAKSSYEVTQGSVASKKIDTGRSISHNIVKVKQTGSNTPSQQSSGSIASKPDRSISHEVVKIKPDNGAKNGGSNGSLDDIERLASLRDKGILTEAEFQAKKRQILGL